MRIEWLQAKKKRYQQQRKKKKEKKKKNYFDSQTISVKTAADVRLFPFRRALLFNRG